MDEEEEFPAIDSVTFKNFISFNCSPEQKYGSKKSEKSEFFKNILFWQSYLDKFLGLYGFNSCFLS